MNHAKKQGRMPHVHGQKQSIETVPKEAQLLDLNFKSAITHMFK